MIVQEFPTEEGILQNWKFVKQFNNFAFEEFSNFWVCLIYS